MKKCFYMLLLIPFFANAQVAENFADGDFINAPRWTGDENSFVVDSFRLRSNGPQASAVLYLATANSLAVDCEWEFTLETKFNPSSTNFLKIYLVADSSNLKSNINGYFLQLGQSGGNNTINIYRQQGAVNTLLFSGKSIFSKTSGFKTRIKITRSASGFWQVFSDAKKQGFLSSEGSFVDDTFLVTSYFGVYCKYSTATRYNMYYLSDIRISPPIKDSIAPELIHYSILDENVLELEFSENVDAANALIMLDNHAIVIDSIQHPDIDKPIYVIYINESFQSETSYFMTITGFEDETGNAMQEQSFNFTYYLLEEPQPGDVLISEVLFNPYTESNEFVEVYNHSSKFILMNKLYLTGMDVTGHVKSCYVFTKDSSKILFPGEYVVLTKNIDKVTAFYACCNRDKWCFMPSFPSYPNTAGTVVVALKDSTIIDKFQYVESMHFPLLKTYKGVSLERVAFDVAAEASDNWHSAAQTSGWATPGCPNSQGMFDNGNVVNNKAEIVIDNPIFSPDNDGYNDILEICYQFSSAGNMANAMIYNVNGQKISSLLNNSLIECSGKIFWDGITDAGVKASAGVYIVLFEVFRINGQVERFKKLIVVAASCRK